MSAVISDERACAVRSSTARARVARRLTVEMIHRSGEGHYGGSLSPIDILAVLYESFVAPNGMDRVILSKGHGAPGYYGVLAERGMVALESLADYGRVGAALQGHPDMTTEPAIHFSTGSLGQGLSVGLGMALALRGRGRVWVILGDGECQEGQVWEAAMLAERLRLSNLIAIVDANKYQEWGFRHNCRATTPLRAAIEKWRAFGWHAAEVDGHDHDQLWSAFTQVSIGENGPAVLIANTIKGKGAALFESDPDRFHCTALTDEEYRTVLEELR